MAQSDNLSYGVGSPTPFPAPPQAVPAKLSATVAASAPHAVAQQAARPAAAQQMSAELLQVRNSLIQALTNELGKTKPDTLTHAIKTADYFCAKAKAPDANKVITLQIIEEIIKHPVNATGISKADQVQIAVDLLENVASPVKYINQVGKTCILASYEVRLATLYPESYAALVMQVALTGRFRCLDGSEVLYPMNSFSNAATSHYSNWASRLFQVTATNIAWHKETKRPDRYEIEAHQGALRYELVGNDEALIDYSVNKQSGEPIFFSNGNQVGSPALDFTQREYVNRMICGETAIINIACKGARLKVPPGVFFYSNMDELHKFLAYAAEGKLKGVRFPIMIIVDGQRLSRRDAGPGLPPKGTHVATIMGYNTFNHSVELNNTWGTSSDWIGDRSLSMAELWGVIEHPNRDDD